MPARHLTVRLLFFLFWLAAPVPGGTAPEPAVQSDVRLLIDVSSGMDEADPDNLRAPALALVARLLPEGTRAGIWTFSDEVTALVPHRVIDARWRRRAGAAAAALKDSGQHTDIPGALVAATRDIAGVDPAYRTSIVLLTAGGVDVSASPMVNASAAREVLTTLAPELGAAGLPVHTVALSAEADWQFLRSLARTTGGIAEKADTAGQLPAVFLQVLEVVAPVARVPLSGDHFRLDDSVQAATVLLLPGGEGEPVVLADPSGRRYTPGVDAQGVAWFHSTQFTLATVTDPVAGAWELQAPTGTVARVTVEAGLQLEVDPLPVSLPAGGQAAFGLWLWKEGARLTDPAELARFAISVQVQSPDGDSAVIDVSNSYPVPADGAYRVVLPAFEEPGRYRVVARVDARTVQRELPMYIEVEATPATSKLVTRGAGAEEQDLRRPLLAAGLAALAALLIIGWVLRRRRRRRLELWQRRSRPGEARGATDDAAARSGAPTGPPGQRE